MDFTDITPEMVGAAKEVHCQKGPGLGESVDPRCPGREFKIPGMSWEAPRRWPLIREGFLMKGDFVVDRISPAGVTAEIKSGAAIASIHEAQLLNYVKLSKCPIGRIFKFHVPAWKDGMKRMRIHFVSLCLRG